MRAERVREASRSTRERGDLLEQGVPLVAGLVDLALQAGDDGLGLVALLAHPLQLRDQHQDALGVVDVVLDGLRQGAGAGALDHLGAVDEVGLVLPGGQLLGARAHSPRSPVHARGSWGGGGRAPQRGPSLVHTHLGHVWIYRASFRGEVRGNR